MLQSQSFFSLVPAERALSPAALCEGAGGNMAEASARQKGGWNARLGRARNCAGGAAHMGGAQELWNDGWVSGGRRCVLNQVNDMGGGGKGGARAKRVCVCPRAVQELRRV